jgi:hypothetical protein
MNRFLIVSGTVGIVCLSALVVVAQPSSLQVTTPKQRPAESNIPKMPKSGLANRRSNIIVPANYSALNGQIRSRLTPAGIAWTAQRALLFRSGQITEAQIRSDAAQNADTLMSGFGQGLSADVETLVFVVMHLAAKDAHDDLRGQLSQTEAVNRTKGDTLSDTSERDNLTMQLAMERMSKMMTTLSNILKKNGDTSAGITNNIK